MKLSAHFDRSEFERDGVMPDAAVSSYKQLCLDLLEPIRLQFGPVVVTSGYRGPGANAEAGGVSHSQHVATADYCAADWHIPGRDMRTVFDWVRLKSLFVWDQLILEHGSGDIIHLSWSTTPRRMALEGATHNASGYTPWLVV